MCIRDRINLVQSLLITYDSYFSFFGLGWMNWILALALAVGVLAQVTAWVGGPSKGLYQVGLAGNLPPVMQKRNKNNVQMGILFIQGGIVTLLSIMFVIMPSVQSAYQIISQLTIILYLIMYMLMFASGIYLRYREPNTPRTFRIPGGRTFGMWIVGGLGFLASLAAFLVSFIPPNQITVGSSTMYILLLVVGTFIFAGIPFIIHAMAKPSWKRPVDPEDAFEPFGWEKNNDSHSAATPSHSISHE